MPFIIRCKKCGHIDVADALSKKAYERWHADAHGGATEYDEIVIKWADYYALKAAMSNPTFWKTYLAPKRAR